MTDADLTIAANGGDERAFEALLAKVEQHITRAIARIPQSQREDAAQECRLVFAQQVLPAWANNRFAGYLPPLCKTAFRRVANDLVRKMHAERRGGRHRTVSHIENADGSESPLSNFITGRTPTPVEILIDRETFQKEMDELRSDTSPIVRNAVPFLIQGYTPGEIDEKLELAEGATSRALYRHRNRRGQLKQTAIVQLGDTGKIVAIHPSVKAAGRALDMHPSTIATAVNDPAKTAAGFRWRHAREGEAITKGQANAA